MMQWNNRPLTYLYNLLSNGIKPFLYRSRLGLLLGAPCRLSVTKTTIPPVGFRYLKARFNFLPTWLTQKDHSFSSLTATFQTTAIEIPLPSQSREKIASPQITSKLSQISRSENLEEDQEIFVSPSPLTEILLPTVQLPNHNLAQPNESLPTVDQSNPATMVVPPAIFLQTPLHQTLQSSTRAENLESVKETPMNPPSTEILSTAHPETQLSYFKSLQINFFDFLSVFISISSLENDKNSTKSKETMLYAHVSSPKESERIVKALKQSQSVRWSQRLHINQWSSKGKSVTELSDLFGRSAATIRDDIKRYNHNGIEGLQRQSSSGAPPQIPLTRTQWEELLGQSPSQLLRLETAARNWNQEFLVTSLHRYHGIMVTRQAIAAHLKRHGIRWNRGRLKVTSPDPLYTVKRDRLDTLKKSPRRGTLNRHDSSAPNLEAPPKRAKLVFFESTDLHGCPEVGFSYVSKGHQTQVESPGNTNPWDALFGRLVYPEGSGWYTLHERKRHQEVRTHLERLLDSGPNVFWLVVMDNAFAHTTPKLDKFWEQNRDRLSVVSLPTYSPHLNLIERLWRVMRGQLTKNRFYPSLTELAQAVVEWFETFLISRFASLMGVDETSLIFI